MSLVAGHTEEVAKWVAARIPHVGDVGFGPCEAIGVVGSNGLIAGVVYHDYQPRAGSIQLSMAADNPRWAKKEIIAGLLRYPFEQLKCYRVWTGTPIDNTMALRVNSKIGFTREAVLAHGFGYKKHTVIMRMLLPDYTRRYINEPRK